MRRTIVDALSRYKPMREECDAARGVGSELRARGQDAGVCQKYAAQVAEAGTMQASQDVGRAPELDGIWTRVAGGNVELKSARDERCVVLAAVGSWEDALATARDLGASAPSIS